MTNNGPDLPEFQATSNVPSASSGVNTAAVVPTAKDVFTVQAQRVQPIPVKGTLVIDMTISRQATRDKFIADFTAGSDQFEENIKSVSAIGNVELALIVHNKAGARLVGTYSSPKDLAQALSEIQCEQSLTQIGKSLDLVPEGTHFIVVNGDTTDGDTVDILVEKAKKAGVPVIPLLEKTVGNSGTTERDSEVLRKMGEASGVTGGPFSYETRMSLLDFVAVASAASAGPEAVQQLKATGKIPDDVWKALPENSIQSIAKAAEPVIAERAAALGYGQHNNDGIQVGGNIGDNSSVTINRGTGWKGLTAAVLTASMAGAGLGYLLQRDKKQVDPTVQTSPGDRLQSLRQAASANILFDTGSATLTPEAINNLQRIASEMQGAGPVCVTISGNASNIGTDALNQTLSQQRAQVVANELRYHFNVVDSDLKVQSLGVSAPQGGPPGYDQSVRFVILDHACN